MVTARPVCLFDTSTRAAYLLGGPEPPQSAVNHSAATGAPLTSASGNTRVVVGIGLSNSLRLTPNQSIAEFVDGSDEQWHRKMFGIREPHFLDCRRSAHCRRTCCASGKRNRRAARQRCCGGCRRTGTSRGCLQHSARYRHRALDLDDANDSGQTIENNATVTSLVAAKPGSATAVIGRYRYGQIVGERKVGVGEEAD